MPTHGTNGDETIIGDPWLPFGWGDDVIFGHGDDPDAIVRGCG